MTFRSNTFLYQVTTVNLPEPVLTQMFPIHFCLQVFPKHGRNSSYSKDLHQRTQVYECRRGRFAELVSTEAAQLEHINSSEKFLLNEFNIFQIKSKETIKQGLGDKANSGFS